MQSTNYRSGRGLAVASLLTGAAIWGLVWYPYRLLAAAGVGGVVATLLSYAAALVIAVPFVKRHWRREPIDLWLLAIALTAGACNLGYVLATLQGQIMRVLLLFYLAPIWTVLLSRWLLAERAGANGLLVVVTAVTGAAVMLWQPQLGLPWPGNVAEWLGLASGFLFALSNVLIRRADHYSIELKSVAVFAGVILVALFVQAGAGWPSLPVLDGLSAILLLGLGAVLVVANVTVQYGLARVAAGRAIVILTFELPVAALASWLLAGETMAMSDLWGGALIVAAAIAAARLEVGDSAGPGQGN